MTEWEVRLLNVRLKCQAECGAELKNMMLNVRVCEAEYGANVTEKNLNNRRGWSL